jgi:hypothetical protein
MTEILNVVFAVAGYAIAWYIHAQPSSPLSKLVATLEQAKQQNQAHSLLQELAGLSQQIQSQVQTSSSQSTSVKSQGSSSSS